MLSKEVNNNTSAFRSTHPHSVNQCARLDSASLDQTKATASPATSFRDFLDFPACDSSFILTASELLVQRCNDSL
jgi:hypothetical protein